MANGRSMRLPARVLSLHAFVVGIGFFVIGLPVVLVVFNHPQVEKTLRDRALDAPFPLLLGASMVLAFYALPLLWPLHMGVGLYEAKLVPLIERGDVAATAAAGRILLVQGAAFTVMAAGVGLWWRGWTPAAVPLAAAMLHVALWRWMATIAHAHGVAKAA